MRILSFVFIALRDPPFHPLYKNGARTHAFHEIICDVDTVQTCIESMSVACMYLMVFCMSKIPEMMDTLWLILGSFFLSLVKFKSHETEFWPYFDFFHE